MIRLSLVGSPDFVSSERVFVIHLETPGWCNFKLCYSDQGFKNQTQFKLHSKMSLVTPKCKLTGFLASSGLLVKLTSNSELMLNKIKPTQSGLTLN